MPGAHPTGPAGALAEVPMLRGAAPALLDRLAQHVVRREWRPGELLVEQGAPGGSLLVLVDGAVTVYRTPRDGSRAALAHLTAPTTLGEVTLLDGAPRSASVEAVEPTWGFELAREHLLGLLATEPGLLDALLVSLAALVRRLSDQAADQVLLDLPARVAKTLVTLAAATHGPPVVRLSQSRIAELAGGSRQSLNQVLGAFAQRGYLRREGREILLLDLAALRRRGGLVPEPAAAPP